MGDQVSMDIHSLATVGMNILNSTVDHYATGVGAPLAKAGSLLAGLVGTNEAQTFAAWHGSLVEAAGAFVKDATVGLESHGSALIVVAANTRKADQSQAEQMDSVLAAFNPTAGQDSVAKDAFKANSDANTSKSSKNHVAPAPNDLHQEPEKATVSPICTEQSPIEQYEEHMKRYGQDEHWTPPDPSQEPVVDPPIALGPGTL